MDERIIANGTHVWATVEYPTSNRVRTINAVIESHSYDRMGVLRYRVRDHETGCVHIVWGAQLRRMS